MGKALVWEIDLKKPQSLESCYFEVCDFPNSVAQIGEKKQCFTANRSAVSDDLVCLAKQGVTGYAIIMFTEFNEIVRFDLGLDVDDKPSVRATACCLVLDE